MRELSWTTTSSTMTDMSRCCEKRSKSAGFVVSPAHSARLKKPLTAWHRSDASVFPVLGSFEYTHAKGMPCPRPDCPDHTLEACRPMTAIAKVARAGCRLFLKKAGITAFQMCVPTMKRTCGNGMSTCCGKSARRRGVRLSAKNSGTISKPLSACVRKLPSA